VLKLFELITGLRMNHAYIRPGGLVQDIPPGALDSIRSELPLIAKGIGDIEKLSNENPLVRSGWSTSATST
jgi:NADH-quinone oxidoreductase subunit D